MPSPTVVQIPGVGNVQFPDSMTPDQINEASHRLYTNAGAAAISANPPAVTKPSTDMETSMGNQYQATSEESTPEGAAAAQARREAALPAVAAAGHAAIGAGKSAAQTLHTVEAAGSRAVPGVQNVPFKQPTELEPQGAAENVGYGLENILEFMSGDEAFKGLSLAEKLGAAQKVAKIAEDSPLVGKALEYGMKALRNTAVGGVVGGLHGGAEGAEAGAAAGGIGGTALEAAGEAAPAVKSLLFPSEDVQSQVTKDLIKKTLGSKVDAGVADELAGRLNPTRMFSSVENELKLVKPQLDSELTANNTQLDSVLQGSTAKAGNAARMVNKTFTDLVNQESAGVGTGKKEITNAINNVRDEVLGKLSNDPMSAQDLNNVKRLIGDQVKKFAPPDLLNSSQKAEQEAYRQAYFSLRDMVSNLVPESKDLNMKISRQLNVQDLLEKKFPQLDTSEAAKASYQGTRSQAAKAAVKKIAGYGTAAGVGEEILRRGINSVSGR